MVATSRRSLFLSSLVVLLVIGIAVVVLQGPSQIWQQANLTYKNFYKKIIPASKKITIVSEATNYRVMPELGEYAVNTASSLNLFESDGVYIHTKARTEKRTIRDLDVIFTDQRQYWPLQMRKDNTFISSFDFAVDENDKGTLKIWINPDNTEDLQRVSSTANLAFFMALYVITNWDTYNNPASGYLDYLDRIMNELSSLSSENRPLVVVN